jgi:hypothetical protein
MRNRLLSFDDEQARRGAYARREAGLQTVEVVRIVGSVGRARDLDRRFRHRSILAPRSSATRTLRLEKLFESGRVPPLELYAIGEDLFVLDGHHRVRVALALGQEFVDAHVVEHLPDRRDPANQVYYERQAFVAATGLDDVHATEPGRYPKLLNRVRDHRHAMARRPGAPAAARVGEIVLGQPRAMASAEVTMRVAARDWREAEYLPVVDVLTAEGVPSTFPGRALGDLYGYVLDHCWYASERRGWDVGLESALADFVTRHAPDSIGAALIDPIVALGSDVLAEAPAVQHWWAALVAGIVALPIAFARGLRPRHYQFRREAV